MSQDLKIPFTLKVNKGNAQNSVKSNSKNVVKQLENLEDQSQTNSFPSYYREITIFKGINGRKSNFFVKIFKESKDNSENPVECFSNLYQIICNSSE
jgi:hypothetical protein